MEGRQMRREEWKDITNERIKMTYFSFIIVLLIKQKFFKLRCYCLKSHLNYVLIYCKVFFFIVKCSFVYDYIVFRQNQKT